MAHLVVWLLLAAMAGCGGSGGDGPPAAANPAPGQPPPEDPPPEEPPPEEPPPDDPPPTTDVSGTWEPEYTDMAPGSASTLAACTGDLAGAEGSASLPMGIACVSDDPMRVSQNGANFEIAQMTCIGAAGAQASGGGTVAGNALSGEFTIAGPDEVQTVFFAGDIAGQRMTVSATRIEVSGGRTGGCDISPPPSSLVVISQ